MKLTTTKRDLLHLLAYILGTWACAAIYTYLPKGVPW